MKVDFLRAHFGDVLGEKCVGVGELPLPPHPPQEREGLLHLEAQVVGLVGGLAGDEGDRLVDAAHLPVGLEGGGDGGLLVAAPLRPPALPQRRLPGQSVAAGSLAEVGVVRIGDFWADHHES